MGVALNHFERAMAEQFGDDIERGAGVEQILGERVPQLVSRDSKAPHDRAKAGHCVRLPQSGREHPRISGAGRTHDVQRGRREANYPSLPGGMRGLMCGNGNDAPRGIDVRPSQADQFAGSGAGQIGDSQQSVRRRVSLTDCPQRPAQTGRVDGLGRRLRDRDGRSPEFNGYVTEFARPPQKRVEGGDIVPHGLRSEAGRALPGQLSPQMLRVLSDARLCDGRQAKDSAADSPPEKRLEAIGRPSASRAGVDRHGAGYRLWRPVGRGPGPERLADPGGVGGDGAGMVVPEIYVPMHPRMNAPLAGFVEPELWDHSAHDTQTWVAAVKVGSPNRRKQLEPKGFEPSTSCMPCNGRDAVLTRRALQKRGFCRYPRMPHACLCGNELRSGVGSGFYPPRPAPLWPLHSTQRPEPHPNYQPAQKMRHGGTEAVL